VSDSVGRSSPRLDHWASIGGTDWTASRTACVHPSGRCTSSSDSSSNLEYSCVTFFARRRWRSPS
jgi:hypothetical protein